MGKSKFHLITYNWLFLLFVFLFLYFWQNIPVWYIIGAIIAYLLVLIVAALFFRWNFYLETVHRGSVRVKQVALTFDDAPSDKTAAILNILKEHKVPAAFFLKGQNIINHRKIVRRAFDENHILGNHSYSHNVKFTFSSAKVVKEDLLQCNELIYKITGKKPLFFRPPFGVTNPQIAKAVNELGLKTIGWSLRSFDTKSKNPVHLLDKLKRKTKAGNIVLLHDYPDVTLKILPGYIQWLKENNFQIVSLEHLINEKTYV